MRIGTNFTMLDDLHQQARNGMDGRYWEDWLSASNLPTFVRPTLYL